MTTLPADPLYVTRPDVPAGMTLEDHVRRRAPSRRSRAIHQQTPSGMGEEQRMSYIDTATHWVRPLAAKRQSQGYGLRPTERGPASSEPLGRWTTGLCLLGPFLLAAAGALAFASPSAASSSLEKGTMIVYRAGDRVAESELVDLGPPANLGATVLEGDPKISARIDYAAGELLAGVFQATRGNALITFPFTEHATILHGEVQLTDQWGNKARLEAGDSYFIKQGSVILWEVRGRAVQKTFFNRTEQHDSPAPMVVYRAGEEIPESALTDLGPPESLGGSVVDGDPRLSARIDYADGHATAGVFQATRGDAQIRFPFTEHATVIDGAVTLRDETGRTHRFFPGDSYMIVQDSSIFWQVARKRVQKSFFNVVAP
jgi:uncharacterized cupin superfamily protein